MRTLAGRLLASGKHFTRSSLEQYGAGRIDVFLLHAGTALEHLLKAYLAELNPALLAHRNSTPSLVWFADERMHEHSPPASCRAIGLEEALKLALATGLPIDHHAAQIDVLRAHRNGVAHMGGAEEALSHEVLIAFLETLNTLADRLAVAPSDLFGNHAEFVTVQIDNSRDADQAAFLGRIEQARLRFERNHGPIGSDIHEALYTDTRSRLQRNSETHQVIDCPACGMPADGTGQLSIAGWQSTGSPDSSDVAPAEAVVRFVATEVSCMTCELLLDTPDLITRSKIFELHEPSSPNLDEWVRQQVEASET